MGPSCQAEKRRLSRSGMRSCRERGHEMGRVGWQHQQHTDKPRGYGHWEGFTVCRLCGADLHLNTHPLPNEIDISGEGVALNCKG